MSVPGNKNAVGNNGGRPTKYTPEVCDKVIEYMREGYSLTACAGLLEVSTETVHQWARVHPEFSEVVKRAQNMRVARLEKDALKSDNAAVINFRKFALGNAARRIADVQGIDTRDWAPESAHIALSNPDGSPLQQQDPVALAVAMSRMIAEGQTSDDQTPDDSSES